ncbi:MAG: hypothetical protein K5783_02080 [Nitrosopumilus sp.]|nr:hypothetical protein [Nitrosopumilus sp.]
MQGKTLKSKFLIILGAVLMIEGLFVTLYLSFVLLSPTEPPTMRPIEGIDLIIIVYRHAFWLSGILGFFITLVGIITFWRKTK